MKIIIYSETNATTIHTNIGKPEYSYYYVLKSFMPMLERMGEVINVSHPEFEVDEIFTSCRARNETCFFLSFSPPHRTITTLKCPTIAVFAWEFDDIPDEKWGVEPRSDWRYVFSRLAGAIVHSTYSAKIVKNIMGQDYPVISIPSPLWSQNGAKFRSVVPKQQAELHFSGWIFDTRHHSLNTFQHQLVWDRKRDEVMLAPYAQPAGEHQALPDSVSIAPVGIVWQHAREWLQELTRCFHRRKSLPVSEMKDAADGYLSEFFSEEVSRSLSSQHHQVQLDGVVYTTVLNPSDGRKNLAILVREFCTAFRNEQRATLVIKSNHFRLDYAVAKVVAELLRQQEFLCRVVVISGYLDDESYKKLLHATTYALNASYGEGQCLPLMEYMGQGIPAISPDHTALADYISNDNAFVINHCREPACWPHDPRQVLTTYKNQIKSTSLRDCYKTSFEVASDDAQYKKMSEAATRAIENYCSIDLMEQRLKEFLRSEEFRKSLKQELSQKEIFGTLSLDAIDSRQVGLSDAVMAGWFLRDSFEITRGVSITASDIVLDVGCGAGGATKFCADAGARVIFSDVDAEKINQICRDLKAKGHGKFEGIVCDSMPLPVESGSVTKILAMEMLEHVDDPLHIMQELVRVGAPGAQYVLTVPDPAGELVALKVAPAGYFESPNHVRIFSRQEFVKLVEDAGLVVENFQQDGFYWSMWMSLFWVSQRAEGNDLSGAALDMVAPPYNEVLECWAKTWGTLLEMPGGAVLKRALDDVMPKRQTIIARKP